MVVFVYVVEVGIAFGTDLAFIASTLAKAQAVKDKLIKFNQYDYVNIREIAVDGDENL